MNKYVIRIDNNLHIVELLNTFDYSNEDMFLTSEEYDKAHKYKKFNPETREFTDAIEAEQNEEITDKQRIEQLEETVGVLAEQLNAKTAIYG